MRRYLSVASSLVGLLSTALPALAEPSARFEDVATAPAEQSAPRKPAAPAASAGAETPQALPPAAPAATSTCPRAEYRLTRAHRYLTERRTLLAMGELSRAITEDPRCGSAYLELAHLRAELGDYGEAELLYAKAMRLRPVSEEALRARSLMRRRQGRIEDALRDLEAYAALSPNDPFRLETLATAYIEIKAWAAALATYRRIVRLQESAGRAPEAAQAHIKVRALSLLAAEADPVSAGASRDRSWVRRAMARFARD